MPKGKYASHLKDVPRYLGDDQSHQDKVTEAKRLWTGSDLRASSLAKLYVTIREEKEQKQRELSEVQVRLDAVEQLLVSTMDTEEISSIKLDSGRSISTWMEPYPQVTDAEAFRLWCIENGLERSLRLWPSTTASLVKQRLMDGKPEPPGITIYAKSVVRLGSQR